MTAFSFPLWASLSRPLAMGNLSRGFVLIREESAFISIMPLLGCGHQRSDIALTLHFLKPAFRPRKRRDPCGRAFSGRLLPRFLPNVDPGPRFGAGRPCRGPGVARWLSGSLWVPSILAQWRGPCNGPWSGPILPPSTHSSSSSSSAQDKPPSRMIPAGSSRYL